MGLPGQDRLTNTRCPKPQPAPNPGIRRQPIISARRLTPSADTTVE